MSKQRLFIGTFISHSDQQKLASLNNHKNQLEDFWQVKVKMVKPKKLHLTWLFLGEIEDELVPEIVNKLKNIVNQNKICQFTYSNIEFWPNNTNARHLVLTPSDISTSALNIREAIESEFKENQKFHPHITILRIPEKAKMPLTLPSFFPLETFLPISHTIDNICLIKSNASESNISKNNTDYIVQAQFELTI